VLSAGDSFGLPPTLDKQYFSGMMRTRVDDCQFLCVTQTDYFNILKQVIYITATADWTVGAQLTLRSWALRRP
jgi:hypothetical protein